MTKKLTYEILNGLYANNFMESHNLRHLTCLQNMEIFDVDSADSARLANESIYPNYVRIESDDDSSLIQLWGKSKRGVVIIEFRKRLFNMIECDKLKLFRECKHEIYKGVEEHRLCVVDNVADGVELITAFVNRLESKKRNKNETTVSSKQESHRKAE